MSDPVNYVLTNRLGEEFIFSNLWMPNISAAQTGYAVNSLYQRPGGIASGEEQIGARRISLVLGDSQEDPEDYVASMNSVSYVSRAAARPCYLEERRSGYRQEVVRESSGETPNDGAWRHQGKKTISFHLLDGNWETIDATTADSTGFLADGESLSVDNPEQVEVDCMIVVIPQTVIESFTLRNTANQNGLTLNNSAFRPGRQIIIDGTDSGAITMNGQNIKMSLVPGSSFIRLAPGLNPIVYESTYGAARLQVSFRSQREEV